MTSFKGDDLSGARFDRVDLSGARFRACTLTGVQMRGAELVDVEIDAYVQNLVINGVDIGPLIIAERDRLDPLHAKLRPDDRDGFREAWAAIEQAWAGTVQRAQALPRQLLHESVDGEWSFIQTLRHLVFATDSWVRRAILGESAPWHPLGLPWDEMPDLPGVPRDRAARPSLDEVLALRHERMATVREVIDGLTDQSLAAGTEPVDAPGWPPPRSFPVKECLTIVLEEEYEHRRFAERDLAVLAPEA